MRESQQFFAARRFRLDLEQSTVFITEIFYQFSIVTIEKIKGEAVGQLAGTDAEDTIRLSVKKCVQFAPHVLRIGIESDAGIAQVTLKDAVTTVEIAICRDIEIVIETQTGGEAPSQMYFDKAELTPEPATIILLGLGFALLRKSKDIKFLKQGGRPPDAHGVRPAPTDKT